MQRQYGHILFVALIALAAHFVAGRDVFAASGSVSFTATVGATSTGIGLAGDHRVTRTVSDYAAVRFELHNPGRRARQLGLSSFDGHFRRVNDIRLAERIILGPGQRKQVIAFVPVAKGENRRLRICASDKDQRRCGKFIARRSP